MNDKPTASIAESLGTVLQRSFRERLHRELTRGLEHELDSSTYPVISQLARGGSSTAATIGLEIGLDRSIVSRRAARLIKAGLVTAGSDPGDARASLLSLTPEGGAAIAVMRGRLAEAIGKRMAEWPATDQELFAELLMRFTDDGPL